MSIGVVGEGNMVGDGYSGGVTDRTRCQEVDGTMTRGMTFTARQMMTSPNLNVDAAPAVRRRTGHVADTHTTASTSRLRTATIAQPTAQPDVSATNVLTGTVSVGGWASSPGGYRVLLRVCMRGARA